MSDDLEEYAENMPDLPTTSNPEPEATAEEWDFLGGAWIEAGLGETRRTR